MDNIRREDWEVLGVEPGADLERVHRAYHARRSLFGASSMATYSLLGTVNWIYKWFRADGEVSGERLAREMPDLFFGGLEPGGRGDRVSGSEREGSR